MRVVFSNDPYINISSNAYFVIDNSNVNAITGPTVGNIITEGELNVVKWNIGNATGNYIVPFTTSTLIKIPLELNILTAGNTATGSVIFSTYRTPSNSNLPYPSDVTNMNSTCNSNNALYAVDRFWRIDAINYSIKPSPVISFVYNNSLTEIGGTNTITQSKLQAQRFNAGLNTWETPLKLYGQCNSLLRKVSNASITPADFFKSWTLIDSTNMLVSKNRTVNICAGQSYFLQGLSQTTSGTYYDTLNVFSKCDTSYVTNLIVSPLPSGIAISTNTLSINCSTPNPSVTITSTTNPVSYSWTPATGISSGATTSSPSFSLPGSYSVVVTNTNTGCSTSIASNYVTVSSSTVVPVVTLSTNALTITCSNPTPSITATSTASPVSYSWSPASGISSGGTTSSPSFSLPGSYSVVVTNTNTGCSSSIASNYVTVSSSTVLPSVTLTSSSNSGTLTCNNPSISITPTITPTSNVTYSWSPSIGISSPTNQANVTFTASGIYTLVVTNTLTGCVTSLTNTANTYSVISNNSIPTLTLNTAQSVTTSCSSPNATLSATSSANPNSVYTWLTPSSSTVTCNPIISASAGVYAVFVTNTVTGCSSSSVSQTTVEVIPDLSIPSVTLSASSLSITCSNPTPSISVTTTASPVSYSWTPATGISSGAATSSPSFSLPGSYSVVVTNTNTGCATNITTNIVNVTLNNISPTLTLSASGNNNTLTCVSLSVSVTPTLSPSTSLTYTWFPGSGISTPLNQANATFTAAGSYTLVVKDNITGCVTSFTNTNNVFNVFQNITTPTITINSVTSNSVIGCSNSTVTFSTNIVSSSSNLTYTWSTGVNTPTIAITNAGTYSLEVTDLLNGCSSIQQFTVIGNTNLPQNVSAGSATNIACGAASSILFGTTSTTNTSYSWAGPTATSILSGSNTAMPNVSDIGIYTLTVTDNLTGCQSSSTVSVTQANVIADFNADSYFGEAPLAVNFTNTSVGATTYNWDFGNGSNSNNQNPNAVFNTSGTYTVTLISSSSTCSDTATKIIIVEDGFTIEIPNVFTPNQDGVNDVFYIKIKGVKSVTGNIFNRWGQLLYSWEKLNAVWDGKAINGESCPDGTYFYMINAVDKSDKKHIFNGSLLIIQ